MQSDQAELYPDPNITKCRLCYDSRRGTGLSVFPRNPTNFQNGEVCVVQACLANIREYMKIVTRRNISPMRPVKNGSDMGGDGRERGLGGEKGWREGVREGGRSENQGGYGVVHTEVLG